MSFASLAPIFGPRSFWGRNPWFCRASSNEGSARGQPALIVAYDQARGGGQQDNRWLRVRRLGKASQVKAEVCWARDSGSIKKSEATAHDRGSINGSVLRSWNPVLERLVHMTSLSNTASCLSLLCCYKYRQERGSRR